MSEGNPARILVIDDNPEIHADFRKILTPNTALADKAAQVEAAIFGGAPQVAATMSLQIDSAFQGEEGLESVKRARSEGRPYSLAFVDVRMPPGWDGIETTRRLWEADPALQVVICTAFSDYSADDITRHLGRTDRLLILKKPFENIEVLQLTAALAEKWRLARQVHAHLDELQSLVGERTHELERSLSMIQATLNATADGILVVDNAGRPITFNDTLLRAWQLPLSRLDKCDNEQALAPVVRNLKNPAPFLQQIRDSLAENEKENSGVIEFKDGRIFEYYSRPQRMGGKVVGRVWSFHDISQRARAEEALLTSENHYRQLFESSPTPIYVYERETLGFLAVNEAAVRHYGYSRDAFTRLTLRDLAMPEEITAFLEKQSHGAAEIGGASVWRHRKKDGKLCEMEITSHPLEFGGRSAWLSLATDVTERLNLEAQLRQSQKMESVGQLAGGIAHDFNNLLTVINGHAGLLLAKEQFPSRIAESLKEISEAAKRAADLTRQLLTFSRKQVLQPQVVDLSSVVNNIGKMLRRTLGEDIELETDFAPDVPRIKADLGMMEQVLLNLAVNSRDAMPKGGKLRIQATSLMVDAARAQQNPDVHPGRFVCLTIADTGCGIAPENLLRIFEPFFTTKGLDRGTGLGLATVYGIVRQHRGWIEVTSHLNEGTTFKIYLPGSDERGDGVAASGADQRVIGGTETILAVEDEAPLLKLIRHILEGHGYKVLECSSGKAALELWSQHRKKIDLLFTDMVLPDMTGPELAEALQKSKPGLRVVFTSGYDTDKLKQTATLKEGVNFIQKPFHARKLAETVYDSLNRK